MNPTHRTSNSKGTAVITEEETTEQENKDDPKKKCFIYVESTRKPSPSKFTTGRHSIGSSTGTGTDKRNLLKQNQYDGLGTATDM